MGAEQSTLAPGSSDPSDPTGGRSAPAATEDLAPVHKAAEDEGDDSPKSTLHHITLHCMDDEKSGKLEQLGTPTATSRSGTSRSTRSSFGFSFRSSRQTADAAAFPADGMVRDLPLFALPGALPYDSSGVSTTRIRSKGRIRVTVFLTDHASQWTVSNAVATGGSVGVIAQMGAADDGSGGSGFLASVLRAGFSVNGQFSAKLVYLHPIYLVGPVRRELDGSLVGNARVEVQGEDRAPMSTVPEGTASSRPRLMQTV